MCTVGADVDGQRGGGLGAALATAAVPTKPAHMNHDKTPAIDPALQALHSEDAELKVCRTVDFTAAAACESLCLDGCACSCSSPPVARRLAPLFQVLCSSIMSRSCVSDGVA